MNDLQRRALEYVQNTGRNATRADFINDHEPIGLNLWTSVNSPGWVATDDTGSIYVTELGEAAMGV